MQNVMIWYTYTVCVQQLSNRESCWHPRSPSSFFHAEGSPTAEHLPGHCCVKPMLISPIPKQKYFPTKKNAQKMNRSKRFRVPMGLLRLFTIYIIIYIYYIGVSGQGFTKICPVLGAIGWIHLGEILCPIAMVAMRHLIHHWRQDDAVHPKLLEIGHSCCAAKIQFKPIAVRKLLVKKWQWDTSSTSIEGDWREGENQHVCVYVPCPDSMFGN